MVLCGKMRLMIKGVVRVVIDMRVIVLSILLITFIWNCTKVFGS